MTTFAPRAQVASRGHQAQTEAAPIVYRAGLRPQRRLRAGYSAARPADGADIDRPDRRSIIVIQEHSGGNLVVDGLRLI